MVVDLLEQAGGFEVGDDLLACDEAVHAGIGGGQAGVELGVDAAVELEHLGGAEHGGVLVEDVDQRQVVALADFIVVEVVGRGDLHAAGAELAVDVVVGDDRDAPAHQRQVDEGADQGGVTLVFRVHGDRAVTQHGFRTGGGDDQVVLAVGGLVAVGQRVAQVPEVALLVVVLHFQVGNGGVELGVPVDQALAAVDQAVLVQAHEGFLDRFGEAVVHGEALARPVHGGAQAADLAGDGAAGLVLPLPDLLEELLAAQVMTGDALRGQLALHHHLGGDAGVVGTRLPQGVAALHAAEADQRVHDGVVEAMAHVQAAGDVRRRDHDGVGLAGALRGEVVVLLPGLVPGSFDGVRLVGLVHARRDPMTAERKSRRV